MLGLAPHGPLDFQDVAIIAFHETVWSNQPSRRYVEASASVSPKDVFIFMHENDYSDWSVGNGVFAMAIAQQRGTDG